jgi:hypothetical protein
MGVVDRVVEINLGRDFCISPGKSIVFATAGWLARIRTGGCTGVVYVVLANRCSGVLAPRAGGGMEVCCWTANFNGGADLDRLADEKLVLLLFVGVWL